MPPGGLRPFSVAASDPARSGAFSAPSGFETILSALPPALIRVTNVAGPPPVSAPVVILLQDIHRHAEAQRAMGKTLDVLSRKKRLDLVGLEAAFGEIDLGLFRAFPAPDAMARAAGYLLSSDKMSPAIHAALGRNVAAPLVGVDDSNAYEANIEAYRRARLIAPSVRERLALAASDLAERKRVILRPALARFDDLLENYRSGQAGLGAHALALAWEAGPAFNARRYPVLGLFVRLLEIERSLDPAAIEHERRAFVSKLVPHLSARDQAEVTQAAEAHRAGTEAPAAFYAHLRRLGSAAGVPMSAHPALSAFASYLAEAETLSADRLLDDLKNREHEIIDAFHPTAEERDVLALSRQLHLTRKLASFSLTRKEWEEYKRLNSKFQAAGSKQKTNSNGRMPRDLEPFQNFYRFAEERDAALASNFLAAIKKRRARVAVLIAGGFHADGVRERLREAGVGIISAVPVVTTLGEGMTEKALSVFARRKTPLERLFEAPRLSLRDWAFSDAARGELATIAAGVALVKTTPGESAEASVLAWYRRALREWGRLTLVGVRRHAKTVAFIIAAAGSTLALNVRLGPGGEPARLTMMGVGGWVDSVLGLMLCLESPPFPIASIALTIVTEWKDVSFSGSDILVALFAIGTTAIAAAALAAVIGGSEGSAAGEPEEKPIDLLDTPSPEHDALIAAMEEKPAEWVREELERRAERLRAERIEFDPWREQVLVGPWWETRYYLGPGWALVGLLAALRVLDVLPPGVASAFALTYVVAWAGFRFARDHDHNRWNKGFAGVGLGLVSFGLPAIGLEFLQPGDTGWAVALFVLTFVLISIAHLLHVIEADARYRPVNAAAAERRKALAEKIDKFLDGSSGHLGSVADIGGYPVERQRSPSAGPPERNGHDVFGRMNRLTMAIIGLLGLLWLAARVAEGKISLLEWMGAMIAASTLAMTRAAARDPERGEDDFERAARALRWLNEIPETLRYPPLYGSRILWVEVAGSPSDSHFYDLVTGVRLDSVHPDLVKFRPTHNFLSADERIFVMVGSEDDSIGSLRVRLLDLDDEARTLPLLIPDRLAVNERNPVLLNGRVLMVLPWDGEEPAQFFDLKTRTSLNETIPMLNADRREIMTWLSPDRRFLVVEGPEAVRVFDLDQQARDLQLSLPASLRSPLARDPNPAFLGDRLLAVVPEDPAGARQVYDLTTGARWNDQIPALARKASETSIAASPSGRYLAISHLDSANEKIQAIQVFDLEQAGKELTFDLEEEASWPRLDPNPTFYGDRLMRVERNYAPDQLYDLENRRPLNEVIGLVADRAPFDVTVSPDGRFILLARYLPQGPYVHAARVYDLLKGWSYFGLPLLAYRYGGRNPRFSPGGRLLYARSLHNDHESIRDLKTGRDVRALIGHPARIDLSPSERYLAASGGRSGEDDVKLFDLDEGREILRIAKWPGASDRPYVRTVSFSPLERLVYVWVNGEVRHAFDIASGLDLEKLAGEAIKSSILSADEKTLVVRARSGVIKVIDLDAFINDPLLRKITRPDLGTTSTIYRLIDILSWLVRRNVLQSAGEVENLHDGFLTPLFSWFRTIYASWNISEAFLSIARHAPLRNAGDVHSQIKLFTDPYQSGTQWTFDKARGGDQRASERWHGLSLGAQQVVKKWIGIERASGTDEDEIMDDVRRWLVPGLEALDSLTHGDPVQGAEFVVSSREFGRLAPSNYYLDVGAPHDVRPSAMTESGVELRVLPSTLPILYLNILMDIRLGLLDARSQVALTVQGALDNEAMFLLPPLLFLKGDVPDVRFDEPLPDDVVSIASAYQSYIGQTVSHRGPQAGRLLESATQTYLSLLAPAWIPDWLARAQDMVDAGTLLPPSDGLPTEERLLTETIQMQLEWLAYGAAAAYQHLGKAQGYAGLGLAYQEIKKEFFRFYDALESENGDALLGKEQIKVLVGKREAFVKRERTPHFLDQSIARPALEVLARHFRTYPAARRAYQKLISDALARLKDEVYAGRPEAREAVDRAFMGVEFIRPPSDRTADGESAEPAGALLDWKKVLTNPVPTEVGFLEGFLINYAYILAGSLLLGYGPPIIWNHLAVASVLYSVIYLAVVTALLYWRHSKGLYLVDGTVVENPTPAQIRTATGKAVLSLAAVPLARIFGPFGVIVVGGVLHGSLNLRLPRSLSRSRRGFLKRIGSLLVSSGFRAASDAKSAVAKIPNRDVLLSTVHRLMSSSGSALSHDRAKADVGHIKNRPFGKIRDEFRELIDRLGRDDSHDPASPTQLLAMIRNQILDRFQRRIDFIRAWRDSLSSSSSSPWILHDHWDHNDSNWLLVRREGEPVNVLDSWLLSLGSKRDRIEALERNPDQDMFKLYEDLMRDADVIRKDSDTLTQIKSLSLPQQRALLHEVLVARESELVQLAASIPATFGQMSVAHQARFFDEFTRRRQERLTELKVFPRNLRNLLNESTKDHREERLADLRRIAAQIRSLGERLAALLWDLPGDFGGASGVPQPAPNEGGVLSGLSILYLEDNPGLRIPISLQMEDEGARVDAVENGEEGLSRLEQGTGYHVIVSDVDMPRMDGIGFFKTVRERFPNQARKVIFLTNNDEDALKERIGGPVPYLLKLDFSIEKLADVIQEELQPKPNVDPSPSGEAGPHHAAGHAFSMSQMAVLFLLVVFSAAGFSVAGVFADPLDRLGWFAAAAYAGWLAYLMSADVDAAHKFLAGLVARGPALSPDPYAEVPATMDFMAWARERGVVAGGFLEPGTVLGLFRSHTRRVYISRLFALASGNPPVEAQKQAVLGMVLRHEGARIALSRFLPGPFAIFNTPLLILLYPFRTWLDRRARLFRLDPEKELDRRKDQWLLMQSDQPLRFGPGLLYHGLPAIEQTILEGRLPQKAPLTRVPHRYALDAFGPDSPSPAVVSLPSAVLNELLDKQQARLGIYQTGGWLHPYTRLQIGLPMDRIEAIWVGADTWARWREWLRTPDEALDDRARTLKGRIAELRRESKIQVITALDRRREPSQAEREDIVARFAQKQGAWKRIPTFVPATTDSADWRDDSPEVRSDPSRYHFPALLLAAAVGVEQVANAFAQRFGAEPFWPVLGIFIGARILTLRPVLALRKSRPDAAQRIPDPHPDDVSRIYRGLPRPQKILDIHRARAVLENA